ncbi:hypothetical protein PAHAL_8G013200 [Panicum hallii]|uniref:Uncharacterized protein n=1 Tax=Panicum hallii TaxID=206008 RepID=A0A2T8I746_9POAL|nr:hypothetical protein PAHAL_8G013200 [Panicum hallii]
MTMVHGHGFTILSSISNIKKNGILESKMKNIPSDSLSDVCEWSSSPESAKSSTW